MDGKDYKVKLKFRFQPRRYDKLINTRLFPACHSGDIQAINAGSSHEHINLKYKHVDGGKGKYLVNNHTHLTQKNKNKNSFWLEIGKHTIFNAQYVKDVRKKSS